MAKLDLTIGKVLEACIAVTRNQADACIGIITAHSIQAPDTDIAVSRTSFTGSNAECWYVLLNRKYKPVNDFMGRMDSDEMDYFRECAVNSDTLVTAQRVWIAFHNANCHLYMIAKWAFALHDNSDQMR